MDKKSLSEIVGINLKRLIKQSKFKTQEKFATEGIKVDPATVRRWISQGIRDINTIYEISIVLEVSIKDLLVDHMYKGE